MTSTPERDAAEAGGATGIEPATAAVALPGGPPPRTAIGPGAFVAVVGPSGVGKDSLLQIAAAVGFHVPRRAITRAGSSSEDSAEVTASEFARLVHEGRFAVSWHAHGLGYGVPVEVDDRVRAGETVAVNVSRSVLEQLAARYARLRVVRVSVDPRIRAFRLNARARDDDIDARIRRLDPAPGFPIDLELDNSGALADAGARLVAFLAGL